MTTTDTLSERLEQFLGCIRAEHEQLAQLAERQRAAIRAADGRALGDCVREQQRCLSRLSHLESARAELVAALPMDHGVSGLSDIIALLPAASRTRLSTLQSSVRELVARVQREYRSLGLTTAALGTHMDSLISRVAQRLSHAGTYSHTGRGGRRAPGAPVTTGLDLST